jgi:hypothetical protein
MYSKTYEKVIKNGSTTRSVGLNDNTLSSYSRALFLIGSNLKEI